jgi:hypothetical protein
MKCVSLNPGVVMKSLLKRVALVSSLFGLAGCVYASPYSEAFPEAAGVTTGGRRVPPPSAASLCQQANEAPGSSTAVYRCITARGRDWDVRGRAIRTQASVVGQAAIPLGIASLGLSAADDRSDFVPLTAGVTTTALGHTGAYARPDQARVYEMATASYRCLEAATGEWNGLGAADMARAYDALALKVEQTVTLLDSDDVREHLSSAEIEVALTDILRQSAYARGVQNRLASQVGREILRRSGEIEDQVREAIGARMPDPQVVAASLVRPAATEAVETTTNTPPVPRDPDDNTANLSEQEKQAAIAKAQETKQVLEAVSAKMREINNLAARFDAAANAYAEEARTISVACVFNPVAIPALIDPGNITLNESHQGSFLMQGGIQPYGYHVLPRDGLSITVQPIGSGWRFDLSATPTSAGPWTIYINDSSSVNGMMEVTVTKKP